MTFEEFNRIQAEAEARGEFVLIDTVVEDPHPGIVDRIAEHLFPWAFPSAEMEAEPG